MLEMIVDPILACWVPKWIVEQYERRNPDFRSVVEELLCKDTGRLLTNRALLCAARKELRKRARRAQRALASGTTGENADGEGGSSSAPESEPRTSDAGSGDAAAAPDVEDVPSKVRSGPLIQEPMPTLDDGLDLEVVDDAWGRRSVAERMSAAGPAPAAADEAVLPPRIFGAHEGRERESSRS